MHTRGHRIAVRLTRAERTRLAKCAKKAGLSLSEFVRRAALGFPNEDEESAQHALINAVIDATARAERAIDDTLRHVARSNGRIKRMEARARHHNG